MSIPFLLYLDATAASVPNALHAYSGKQQQKSTVGSVEKGKREGGSHLVS